MENLSKLQNVVRAARKLDAILSEHNIICSWKEQRELQEALRELDEETPKCSECDDCQGMIGFTGRSYRCYGDNGICEIKKDIGTDLPETSPSWCPRRS